MTNHSDLDEQSKSALWKLGLVAKPPGPWRGVSSPSSESLLRSLRCYSGLYTIFSVPKRKNIIILNSLGNIR